MHHKRKRPKNRRAGCLMCKPHKANGIGKKKHPIREQRKLQDCGTTSPDALKQHE